MASFRHTQIVYIYIYVYVCIYMCVCAQIDFITGVSGNGQPQPETIGFLITNRANTFPMFDDFGVFKLRTTLFHMISFSSNSPTLISESQVACCIAIAYWKIRWSRNEASTIRLEFFFLFETQAFVFWFSLWSLVEIQDEFPGEVVFFFRPWTCPKFCPEIRGRVAV